MADVLEPPHDLDAEQCVLGAVILLESVAALRTLHEIGLRPKHFYRDSHRVVFEAMQEMGGLDSVLLVAHLRDTNRLAAAGGRAGVDLLASSVPQVGHFREYARVMIDLHRLRTWLYASGVIVEAVAGRDWGKLAQVGAWCASQAPETPA